MSKKNSLTMPDGTQREYQPIVLFKCMHCGGMVSIIAFKDNREHATTHTIPECPEFIASDPLTFVTEHRKKFQQDVSENKPN